VPKSLFAAKKDKEEKGNNGNNGNGGNNGNSGNNGNGNNGNGGGNNGNGNNGNKGNNGNNGNGNNGNNGNGNNKDKEKKDKSNNGKGNGKGQRPEEELQELQLEEELLQEELQLEFYPEIIVIWPEIIDKKPQYLINPQSRVTYTYDAVGNRISMENDEGRTEYCYNAANQLIKAGDVDYEYDLRGNLLTETSSKGVKKYTYDGLNLLKEVMYSDGTYVRYGHDALGRMVYREDANYDLNEIRKLKQSMEEASGSSATPSSNGNGSKGNNGNGNGGNNGNGNNGNGGNNGNNGNGNSKGNNGNNGNNGNGYGKYNNPGQGNKYGIYKHEAQAPQEPQAPHEPQAPQVPQAPQEPQVIRFEPSDIERSRYLYLGQSDTLHKEYSPKGAPYAEFYQANGQVISQKMFGLHGRITPGKEETLKTNGGLMYYQYDGIRNVVGLTNRHGDEIEEYRYDAFGNIFTGITAPYNSVGYTGHEYDEKSGLINMSARWYNSSNGRFITQDTYQGDIYTPQSLNRYAYVMNNPVNMWDPTGHVPSWVGDSMYYTVISGTPHVDEVYYLQSSSSSTSDWSLINKITNLTEIIYTYKATVTKSWTYRYLDFSYTTSTDPETGETLYEYSGTKESYVTYRDTEYYYKDVVKKASEIAQENEEYIRNLAGDPPGDNDPPMFTISTMQVDNGRIELLNPDEIILKNTGKKPTASERLIAGAVQSELNSIFNAQLDVDGWYGKQSAATVKDLQKELSLPATGVLDVQTFYQLQLAIESGASYKRTVAPVSTSTGTQPTAVNAGTKNDPSNVPGEDNENEMPDNKVMIWPTESTNITSDFGYRIHPISKNSKLHEGIDIGATTRNVDGDKVYAATSGTVVAVTNHSIGGNIITIQTTIGTDSIKTKYMHLKDDSIKVKKGDKVEKGEVIAEMGHTGGSVGTHLHFQVEVYDEKEEKYVPVDPMKYLK
jgi:RHS repeat-associated protein